MKKQYPAAMSMFFVLLSACSSPTDSSALSQSVTSQTQSSLSPSSIPNVTLNVWSPTQEQQFIKDRAEEFKLLFPQWNLQFNFLVVSEVDAKGLLLLDIENGGDIFAFPDDQLESIVEAGGLAEVSQFKDSVESRNIPWTVDVAKVNNKLYAYPNTADNGTYMYYDKRYISEEEMMDFDTIIAKARSLNSFVNIDPMGGWSMAMWFTATNNISWSRTDWEQTIDWNNEAGLKAAKTMFNYYATNRLIDNGLLLPTQFTENNVGNLTGGAVAGMSGYWHTKAILQILGENMGTIKMPTYKNVDGDTLQFGSMVGARLLGVNAYSKFPGPAHAFANYLTSEEVQLKRSIELLVAPSNITVSQNPQVQALPTFKALADQSPFGIPQARSVSQYYWNPAAAFAANIIRDAKAIDQKVAAEILKNPSLDPIALKEQLILEAYEKIQGYLDILVQQVTNLPPKR